MSDTIIREWYFMLYSIAAGIGMAFAYDFLRLFRRLVKHRRWLVDMEDILYWTACFLLSFYLLYYGNNGVLRFFAVIGAGAGMCLYEKTVGRFLVRGICRVISFVCKPVVLLKNRLTHFVNQHTIKVRKSILCKMKRGEMIQDASDGKRTNKKASRKKARVSEK